MKGKETLISCIVFAVAAVAATVWYISLHASQGYDLQTITRVFLQIGWVSACITTLFFLLIILCMKKIKDKGLRFFLIFTIVIFFLAFVWQLTLNMVFYQMDAPEPFVKFLFDL